MDLMLDMASGRGRKRNDLKSVPLEVRSSNICVTLCNHICFFPNHCFENANIDTMY